MQSSTINMPCLSRKFPFLYFSCSLLLLRFPVLSVMILSLSTQHLICNSSCPPFLSTILGATVTYQCDHPPAIRAVEDRFDICTIGVGKTKFEYVEVVLRMLRNAQTRAFFDEVSQAKFLLCAPFFQQSFFRIIKGTEKGKGKGGGGFA